MTETDIYVYLYRIYDDNERHAVQALDSINPSNDDSVTHDASVDFAKTLLDCGGLDRNDSSLPSEILDIIKEVDFLSDVTKFLSNAAKAI